MRLLYMGFGFGASTMAKVMRTKPANPLWKRLQRRWRVQRGFQDAKTHEVDWVWVDGQRHKRVTFQDADQAKQTATALQALAQTGCFPDLIRHQGAEVWVSYIKKDIWPHKRHEAVATFFATLYGAQLNESSRVVPATVLLAGLMGDLKALKDQQLIDGTLATKVDAFAHRVAPAVVVQGFDYVDAIKKNFVITQGRAIGIDVEALLADQCLGLGLAKAEYRGLIDDGAQVINLSQDERLVAQYPLVRLVFLIKYFRQKIQQGKPGHIRLSALTELLE